MIRKMGRFAALASLAAASGAVLAGTAQATGNSYDGPDGRDGGASANCRISPMGQLTGMQQCQSTSAVGHSGAAY